MGNVVPSCCPNRPYYERAAGAAASSYCLVNTLNCVRRMLIVRNNGGRINWPYSQNLFIEPPPRRPVYHTTLVVCRLCRPSSGKKKIIHSQKNHKHRHLLG